MNTPPPPPPPPRHQFETGAQRDSKVAGETQFPLRFDLLIANISFMKRMAATYGEGAIKYGDENWRNGMPEKSLVNHAMAHLVQWISGDRSEDHLAHMCWNIMTLMWVADNKPELLDLCKAAKIRVGTEGTASVGCDRATPPRSLDSSFTLDESTKFELL